LSTPTNSSGGKLDAARLGHHPGPRAQHRIPGRRVRVARTLALSRVDGELIKVLDADDQLTPGALGRDIAAFDAHPQIGWTTSRVLDLLPDGSTAGWDKDPAGGVIDRGAVLTFWQANDYRASVHPATLCLRRDLVFALGGWMALPASEDTGLLLAANAVTAGYFTREYGLLYRKWPGQVTSQAAHREPAEYQARMRIIEARAHALTSMVQDRCS
jgi:glycosyltransferase involved in cell wall biosynthesis